MATGQNETSGEPSECTVHAHPVPAGELSRYSVEGDPHGEGDIRSYVEGQARDEVVQHVERVKREVVLGQAYEIWDVTTDRESAMTIVHVALLGEGTVVWRSAQANHVQGAVYQLLGAIPDDEQWQFNPGQLVECEEQVFSGGGSGLVARRLIAA